jgi:hypothetical protein
MKKLGKCERRVIRQLGLPPDALLAVSLGLPPDWVCHYNPHNMNCNSCGGKLCGQVERKLRQ